MSATEVTIFASVLGLLIAGSCIGIPQLVRQRSQKPEDDGRGYLDQTGRTAQDIAKSNADVLSRQAQDAESARTATEGKPRPGA